MGIPGGGIGEDQVDSTGEQVGEGGADRPIGNPLQAAIAEGATHVRIGSAIFGSR